MRIESRRSALRVAGALAAGTLLGRLAGAQPTERVIAIVARKFEFVPAEIHLKRGEAVVLELSAPEVMMGLASRELGLRADIVPGAPTRLRFTPDKAGRFAFVCDVFCGSGHEEMAGALIVAA